jgi:hypothetical protein
VIGRRLTRTLVVIGVLIAAAVLTSVGARTVDAIVGVALLFIVPGWLITSWSGYFGAALDLAERVFWVLVVSAGGVVLSGLLLNVVGSLTRRNWIICEVAVILVLLAIDWLIVLRNPGSTAKNGTATAGAGDGSGVSRRRSARRVHLPVISPVNIVLLAVSLVLVVSALWLSEASSADHQHEPVLQLSMIPVPIARGSFASLGDIGVGNQTGTPVTVEVRLFRGSPAVIVGRWSVHLREDQQWSKIVSRSPDEPLVATVAYASNSAIPIAWVSLGTPARS